MTPSMLSPRSSFAGPGARGALCSFCALMLSCVRAPAERLCPEVGAGALVVSELWAMPSGQGAAGIELYNASGVELDLLGLGVRMRRLDGGAEQRLLVRRSLLLGAGALLVLSQEADDEASAHARYGFAVDAPAPFYAAGAMAVESCEVEVDRMTYARLPAEGSLALGEWPPSSEANDRAGAWCVDGQASPGQRNPSCR